jgi:hypothetical protein
MAIANRDLCEEEVCFSLMDEILVDAIKRLVQEDKLTV